MNGLRLRHTLWIWGVLAWTSAMGQVVINELVASNSMLVEDPDFNQSSDWVELFNAGSDAVDVSGWHLTDNANDTTKWTFPAGTVLEPGAFVVVWCDGENSGSEGLHAGFKLSSQGEEVALYQADLVQADHVVFGMQSTDISLGRAQDGSATWGWFNVPTPGESNNGEQAYAGVTYGVPTFSASGGFYSEPVELALTALSGTVHYTTDGREPTLDDPVASAPWIISASAFIRARVFH